MKIEPDNIYCGDCLELMKEMPDKSVDLVLTDPPYGIGAAREKPHNGWSDYGISDWDLQRPTKEYFNEIRRVSKNQIIWGGNYFSDYLSASMGWLFWDKGQRGFSLSDGELAWTSFNKALRVIDYSRAKALGDVKCHPTQKAVAVMNWCIMENTKPNDLIFDPFLGSGTTAVACIRTGRHYIGMEIDPTYFEIAQKRINLEKSQLRMEL